MNIVICQIKNLNTIILNLSETIDENNLLYLDKQNLKVLPFCFNDIDKLSNCIDKEKIEAIQVCSNIGDKISSDLLFFNNVKNTSQIKNIDILVDLKGVDTLYKFSEVESLRLCCFYENYSNILDVSLFHKLKRLDINGNIEIKGFDKSMIKELSINESQKSIINVKNDRLEILRIIHSNSFNLKTQANFISKLKKLILTQVEISNLDGIDSLVNLESIELNHCNKLMDISAIEKCKKLKKVCFENTKKIVNFKPLTTLNELKDLTLFKCGDVVSLDFIKDIPSLERLIFTGTNIVDGDLIPCMRLKSAWSSSDKRHYNIGVADLPSG